MVGLLAQQVRSTVPFKSKAQRRALYAKNPALAREFEAATPKGKKLPEKVAKKGKRKRA